MRLTMSHVTEKAVQAVEQSLMCLAWGMAKDSVAVGTR